MKTLIPTIHGAWVYNRRVQRIARILAEIIPRNASVLDVGCGDGLLSSQIQCLRPDLNVRGIDVLVRKETHIPVMQFDGIAIPERSGSLDVVLFADVLHHTVDPMILLREAARVARHCIVMKDHTRDSLLAGPVLRFMDFVGNAHHGVALPYNYWPRRRWLEAFQELGLTLNVWRDSLRLYPWPADLMFGRSLHFVARLVKAPTSLLDNGSAQTIRCISNARPCVPVDPKSSTSRVTDQP